MKLQGRRIAEAEYPNRIIRIAKELTGEMEWSAFYHEYRHAMQFELGWTQIMDRQAMELDCEQFASAMVSLADQGLACPKFKRAKK